MFTRLALMALTGMSGRLLRWPRSRGRRRERAASAVTRSNRGSTGEASTGSAQTGAPLPPPAAEQTQSSPRAATAVTPSEEHVGRLRPRARAPLVAAIAARSLPLLGI